MWGRVAAFETEQQGTHVVGDREAAGLRQRRRAEAAHEPTGGLRAGCEPEV